jgi:putative DNA primase/helicase
MAGAPGTGKTTAAVALAATLTIGDRWPDSTRADVGDVLLWSGEDDPTDTLVPRLIAAGADLSRVHFVSSFTDGKGSRAFDPATDTEALSDHLATMNPAPVLLIVDPIVSAIQGDSHKNAEVRRSLQPLVDLAQVRRVAVLGISHFSKGTQG